MDVKEYSYGLPATSGEKPRTIRCFEVHRLYSGKLFARVAAGTRADGRIAVDAAAKAFPEWAVTTPAEKARSVPEGCRHRQNAAEVRSLKCWRAKPDRPFSFAKTFQQDLVAATLQQVAGWVYLPKGEVLETNAPGSHSIGVRERSTGRRRKFHAMEWRQRPLLAGRHIAGGCRKHRRG